MPWWSWFLIGGTLACALVYYDCLRNPARVRRDAPGGLLRSGLLLGFLLGMVTLGTPLWMTLDVVLGV